MERKRGMALAEACVVVAIIALISVTLVSLAVFISRESKNGTQYLDTTREIRLAESMIEEEIYSAGNADKISFSDGVLTVGERRVNLSQIQSISFENIDGDEAFYVFVFSYELSGKEHSYRFAVDPIVNDVIRVSEE